MESALLLDKISTQTKSKGIIMLFSIRMIIGWIGLICLFLLIGYPTQIILTLLALYFLLTSYLYINNTEKRVLKNDTKINLILFFDYIIIVLAFYYTIYLFKDGNPAVPFLNSGYYTLFIFYLLYSGFTLNRKFWIFMSISLILAYIGGWFLSIKFGAEFYTGSGMVSMSNSRLLLKVELLKVLLLIAISICYNKLITFLISIVITNNILLAKELEEQEISLIENERLITLSHLAANIAHEINNPIAGLKATVESNLHEFRIFMKQLNYHKQISFSFWDKVIRFNFFTRKERYIKEEELSKIDFGLSLDDTKYLIEKSLDLGIDIPFKNSTKETNRDTKESFLFWLRLCYAEKTAAIMINAIQRTEKIVDSLKYISQPIFRNEKEQIHIADSLNEIIFLYSSFWTDRRSLEINIINNFKILANNLSLKLVWSHLIYNAIQATGLKNSKVIIKVFLEENMGVVEVGDNGQGIPSDIHTKVFTPFFTTKEKGEGIGIGLAIVKEIIKAHGGKISFESKNGETIFRVLFPSIN